MNDNLKYVKTKEGDIILFPANISHDTFKTLNPISAGFCRTDYENKKVTCFGSSFSLGLTSYEKEDTLQATSLVFGFDAMLDLAELNK